MPSSLSSLSGRTRVAARAMAHNGSMRPDLALAACVLMTGLCSCGSPPSGGPADGKGPPNIVLVVSDDQGLGDFGHAGHGVLQTPHLDRLARESPKVARFYVSPVCSPTRASLMTGRSSQRTRVVDTWAGRSMMEPDEVTIAEVLRGAGYGTGIFGKWHLGDCYPLRPMEQGFDEVLVHRGGGLAQPSEPPENGRRYTDPILFHNGEQIATEGYCTDVYFDAALGFIDEQLEARRPFFAYVATNAPHDPFHDVPPELYDAYRVQDLEPTLRGKSDQVDREARICAMVENIDQNVGRLLEHLEARGVTDDTIVVFLNDNGPLWGRFSAGLRGHKTGVHEGGIRAPLFVRWPGVLGPDTTVEPLAAHIDVMPTLLDAAGVAPPEGLTLDGRSLLGLLRGERVAWPERSVVMQSHRGHEPSFEHHFALLGERWKLVRASGFGAHEAPVDHPFELYDLTLDPGETRDLAAEQPEVVADLRAEYARWFEDVSTTRPDNFAPPAIVVGHPASPRTVLTRQDWRPTEGEGWGAGGSWRLQALEPVVVEVTLLFLEPQVVDQVVASIGDETFSLSAGDGSARTTVGRLALPPASFDFQVECHRAGERIPVHQVELAIP
jgi:arylsulfatase/arylsulfatase A